MLGLSQKAYINKVLEKIQNEKMFSKPKKDEFSLMQWPKNELECKQMNNIPYALIVGRLMNVQTCTKPDNNFVVKMLSQYKSNLGFDH